MKISKNSEFEGVGSTVEVGFDYRGLACITWDSKGSDVAGVGSAVEVGFEIWGLACISRNL